MDIVDATFSMFTAIFNMLLVDKTRQSSPESSIQFGVETAKIIIQNYRETLDRRTDRQTDRQTDVRRKEQLE